MVDNFKSKNGKLPIGLNELGVQFEKVNNTYRYKDYVFYYEPRKDGNYWLTLTFGYDENYCYNSKHGSWIWGTDSAQVEMYKKYDRDIDSDDEADR